MTGKNTVEKEKMETVKDLLSLGVGKGFLTFKEIDDNLSKFIVDKEEMDAILHLIEQNSVEIVENEKKYQKTKSSSESYSLEENAEEGETVEGFFDDIETISGGVSDPVRLYLRKMGGVSLLSRDGEIEIARRIEEGENKILNVVFNSELGISGIVDLADKLRKGRYRVSDLVKGGDDMENAINETSLEKKILESIELIQKLFATNVFLNDKLLKLSKPGQRDKIIEEVEKNREKMRESFREINLNRKTINKIISKFKIYHQQIKQAEFAIKRQLRKVQVSNINEFNNLKTALRKNPKLAKQYQDQASITVNYLDEISILIEEHQKVLAKR